MDLNFTNFLTEQIPVNYRENRIALEMNSPKIETYNGMTHFCFKNKTLHFDLRSFWCTDVWDLVAHLKADM